MAASPLARTVVMEEYPEQSIILEQLDLLQEKILNKIGRIYDNLCLGSLGSS